ELRQLQQAVRRGQDLSEWALRLSERTSNLREHLLQARRELLQRRVHQYEYRPEELRQLRCRLCRGTLRERTVHLPPREPPLRGRLLLSEPPALRSGTVALRWFVLLYSRFSRGLPPPAYGPG